MIKSLITSTDNKTVKFTASLLNKKYRKEHGCFIAEGANIISAIPESFSVGHYIVRNDRLDEYGGLCRKGADVYPVTESVFNKVSDTVEPQGIIAVVRKPEAVISGGDALVLDRIADAGNLGTILRTAAAAGYYDIYSINCADAYAPKTVRSSMGGVFFCNIIEASADTVISLKSKGYWLAAADMNGTGIFDANIPNKNIALLIGSEAHGVDSQLKKECDAIYSIPMQNIESLNAAVAGSILMYQLKMQRNK